jgi:hypothetical protein
MGGKSVLARLQRAVSTRDLGGRREQEWPVDHIGI